jgi:hypothetical protein
MLSVPLNEPLQDIHEIPDLLLPVTLISPQSLVLIPDVGIS